MKTVQSTVNVKHSWPFQAMQGMKGTKVLTLGAVDSSSRVFAYACVSSWVIIFSHPEKYTVRS